MGGRVTREIMIKYLVKLKTKAVSKFATPGIRNNEQPRVWGVQLISLNTETVLQSKKIWNFKMFGGAPI